MYENFKLCPELTAKERCLVLEQYADGVFERCYHRHFPKNRISNEVGIAMLKAFVVRFSGKSGLGADQIVSAYLNERGKDPSASNPFRIVVSHPEPGVIRHYCGTNTRAWLDTVISSGEFRAKSKSDCQ